MKLERGSIKIIEMDKAVNIKEISLVGQTAKMPPQNIEAETSLLGALMLDKNAIYRVADIVKPDDFYRENHKIIYETMLELSAANQPIDILLVSSKLEEKNLLETIGGSSYLTELINSVPTASNIEHYADLIRKKRILRDLIAAAQNINELGYNESEDVDQILDEAEKEIFAIASKSLKKMVSIKSALAEAWERIDRIHKTKGELRGVPTGFFELDNYLSGLQRGDLIILAARPSLGKTALALDIARNAASKYNIPVGIFSLEMSTSQLTDRLIAAEAQVDLWKLRTGRLSTENDDFERIRDSMDRLAKAPIYIDDAADLNILQIKARARRLQAEHGLGLIIIDYLQLMVPRFNSDSIVHQVTEISRSLKALAKELNVPVLAISQLSRAVENRHPPIPKLADLRESGSIEQDADVVLLIYREDKYKENSQRKNQADIAIAKHRNGPVGKVTLYFNPEKASFTSLEENYSPDAEL